MALENLKNLDVKDLFANLKKSGLLSDKKLLIKFGIGAGAILIFLIIYYAFISPLISSQKEKILIMDENIIKREKFKNDRVQLKPTIKKLEPEFEKNSRLFHSNKEVEDLYQNISNFALANGLSIVNLKKSEPKGVNSSGQAEGSTEQSNDGSGASNQFMYYKIPVAYEIRGSFLGYLKFRRALAGSQKVVNFDQEEIDVVKDTQGKIIAKGTISIVGLPDEYK